MAEVGKIEPFKTIQYTTIDGEKVTATKKDGIVTINGDKRGIVQMPVEDFIQNEILKNVPKMTAPITEDTVQIAGENKTAEVPNQTPSEQQEGKKVNIEV